MANDNERRIMSQEGGPRNPGLSFHGKSKGKNLASQIHDEKGMSGTNLSKNKDNMPTLYSSEMYGNPAYTIKEGGALKRKVQPMAADRVKRDFSFVPKE
jgi:hypothetical protein